MNNRLRQGKSMIHDNLKALEWSEQRDIEDIPTFKECLPAKETGLGDLDTGNRTSAHGEQHRKLHDIRTRRDMS